ncbi:purple acid phosphatase-like protein [Cytobacillus oceanisediminis]|uniref:Purple acid phosphatase-like protein n=1 Tax=Cytobacillus oceanisediminis TaxID=665099 RepID=A0A2V2ZJJ1_9BACI|nr:phosphodiester glycosidase family protein [Cytobacillus oceanisediminis]PWW20068.1 purple acid phosphatase-like protein [Cytobacillus oceanisediminis]
MYLIKKGFFYFLAILLASQSFLFHKPLDQKTASAASFSLGSVIEEWTRPVATGVHETEMTINSEAGRQEIFIMNINTDNPDIHIEAGLPNGKDFGMQTVSEQASSVSKPGHVVVGGVNGDFFNTANGIPLGPVIHEGKILKASNTETFGIKENGKAIIGYPNPSFSAVIREIETKIHSLNGTRGANQLAVYTSNMKMTGTNHEGTEVLLSEVSGDIREPGTLTAKVEKVMVNQGNSEIPDGKLILSGSGTASEKLKTLASGEEIELKTEVAAGWEDVKQALGGRITLIKNGQKVQFAESSFTTTRAPRTAAAIKADGSIFFLVLDGRQPGYSEGVTVFELRDLLYELGAVEALNLDGGGSSTYLSRTNGEDGLSLGNQPSDGNERGVANSFLVVSTAPQGELQQLAVQPDHLLMLAGSTYDFNAKGMDTAFNPVQITKEPNWSMSDQALGTISADGIFTAGEGPMSGQLLAGLSGAKGASEITIVNQLSDLQLPQDTLTVKRGDEIKLDVKAILNGRAVHANPSNFKWEIIGDIGSVDKNGVFKASRETAEGSITVRYGDKSDTINIQVGKMPVILETFENGLDQWTFSGARYQSVAIRQTTYPEPARFGNHALELKYDFTGTIGTSGAYAYPKEDIIIEDYPETIGMWVYGDGNGHWLRSQLRDGNNNAFPIDFETNMDWKGWKYVEASVPPGKETPLKLDLAVRLMETSNDNKNAGAIYVDNIRAVYGETNDDLMNPEISQIYPAENEVIPANELKISAVAKDNENGTGINPSRIKMYLDGNGVMPEFNEETGEIAHTPSQPLLDGYHEVRVIVQDHFGNESERVWQFEIDSGSTGLKPVFETEAYLGSPYEVLLQTNQLHNMKTLKLHFSFDNKKVQPQQDKVLLDNRISEEHIAKNEITKDGQIYLELKDIQNIEGAQEIKELGRLPFLIPANSIEPIEIKFVEGTSVLQERKEPVSIYMPDIKAVLKAHYKIDVDRASVGFDANITVKSEDGKAVNGAAVKVLSPNHKLANVKEKESALYESPDMGSKTIALLSKHASAVVEQQQGDWTKVKYGHFEGWLKTKDVEVSPWILGTTDQEGKIKTDRLSIIPSDLIIQVQKEQKYSFITNVKVLEHLGSQKPERLNLTFSEQGNSMNITWTTSPLTANSVVELVETEHYEKSGFEGKEVKTVKGKSSEYAFDAGEVQVHSASINGLKRNTSYTYRAGDGSEEGWSETAAFTARSRDNNPFSFILMGDTQAPPNQTENGFGIFTELFQKAKQEDPDASFMLHVGDMIDDGNLYTHWNAFFESMKNPKLAPSTPFVPAVGNHENIGTGVETFKHLFKLPQNGPEKFKGTVYSFDYGNAHFAVMNTETSKEGLLEQAEWLKEDMAGTDKKWKIVVYHRSPYYSNPAGGSEMVKEVWPSIFDELDIDLAISGHDHSYVRTFPLKNGEKAENGTTYVIAGSTGKKFYAATPQPYMDVYFDEDTQVYTNVSIDDQGINLIVKTRDGRIVDQHSIKK